MKDFAIAIFGPTGVGKTSLAIKLAKDNGQIISVDSMQVYKYMNIGTAKPSVEEIRTVKHYLIDIINPDNQFTAGNFCIAATNAINSILSEGKVPYLVGGTGLYFLSLIRGMVNIPKIDKDIRNSIIHKWNKFGQDRMFKILERIDNGFSKKIHKNDKQRTLRALEVFFGTKKKFSDYLKEENKRINLKFIKIGININRRELYNIINLRVDKMIQNGLVDEINELKRMGYTKDNPGLKAIGYKEMLEYLDKNISLNDAIELIKKNSRKYAKRQITWFNKTDNVKWFNKMDFNAIKSYLDEKILEFEKNY